MSSKHDSHSGGHHSASHYIRIYWILFGFLILSIAGPVYAGNFGDLGHVIVLITAYGIAIIKAIMVAGKFMHLEVEKKYIWWLLITGLVLVFVCFAGLAPDAMNPNGTNWENHNPFVTTIPEVREWHAK